MPLGYMSAVIATCLSALLVGVLDQHGTLLRAWTIGVPLAIFVNLSLCPQDLKIRGKWNEAEEFWKGGAALQDQQLAVVAVLSLIWPALLPYRLVNAVMVLLFMPLKEPERCACGAYVEAHVIGEAPKKCTRCYMKDAAEYRIPEDPWWTYMKEFERVNLVQGEKAAEGLAPDQGRKCRYAVQTDDDFSTIVEASGVDIEEVNALNPPGDPELYWQPGKSVTLPHAACAYLLARGRK